MRKIHLVTPYSMRERMVEVTISVAITTKIDYQNQTHLFPTKVVHGAFRSRKST